MQGPQRIINKLKNGLRPEQIIALGFAALILSGALLLSLPLAASDGESVGFFRALFTATSSVCVTGLVVLDTGLDFSLFGQIIIILLIQIGGLGLMAIVTMMMVALGRRISLRERVVIKEAMNESKMTGVVRLTLLYSLLAIVIELIGALILSIKFIPLLGVGKGLYYSVFHAVSAFCNAGFDLFGNYNSLVAFAREPLILLPISLLIIFGGLGFSVLLELRDMFVERKRPRLLTLHAKIVLTATMALLVIGTIGFALLEWGNVYTLGLDSLNSGEKIMNSWFQSVTLRTAGFNSIEQLKLTDSSKLLGVIFMFVGASPASTGGGVKVSTLSVLILILWSVFKGREDVNAFHKRLPVDLMRKALAILFVALSILLLGTMLITLLEKEKGFEFIDLLYEAASALGTVGITTIGTRNLTMGSQIILILMMFIGRVGPVTMVLAMGRKQQSTQDHIHYPEERIMLG